MNQNIQSRTLTLETDSMGVVEAGRGGTWRLAALLDPRVTILAFLSIAAWLTSTRSVVTAAGWCATLIIVGAIARRHHGGIRADWERLRWALPMALVVFLLYVIMVRGEGPPLVSFGWFVISRMGVTTGFHLAVRLLGFVFLAGLLTDLTQPSGLAAGLTRLLLPLRKVGVKVETIYHLVLFTTRMVPLLAEELWTIKLGQRSRGIRFEGSLRRRVSASLSLIIPAFASALRRSERLSLALATRGFDPDRVPASVTDLRLSTTDISLLAALLIGWFIWLAPRVGLLDRWTG